MIRERSYIVSDCKVLNGENMREAIFKMIQELVEKAVDTCISDEVDRADWNLTELNELILPIDTS